MVYEVHTESFSLKQSPNLLNVNESNIILNLLAARGGPAPVDALCRLLEIFIALEL